MRRPLLIALVAVAVAALAAIVSCDPVHGDAKSALGGEAPGVGTGPTHRPGQPCLVCHDGAFGDPPEFSAAGTVFREATGRTPLAGVTVTLQNADGTTTTATTNEAGNFYLTPAQYAPGYPIHTSIALGNVAVGMHSHIGGNGSCAACHFDPASPNSPGHVYFDVPDGGMAP